MTSTQAHVDSDEVYARLVQQEEIDRSATAVPVTRNSDSTTPVVIGRPYDAPDPYYGRSNYREDYMEEPIDPLIERVDVNLERGLCKLFKNRKC